MSKIMELKCFGLDLNQFDFILDSVIPHLSNPTQTKCLQSEDGLKIEYTKCPVRILDEKIYAVYQSRNAYLNLFNSIVQKYKESQLCSCKTLICLTIIIWKRLNPVLSAYPDLNVSNISKYLRTILNETIDVISKNPEKRECIKRLTVENPVHFNKAKLRSRHFIKSNFKYKLNENNRYFKELLLGLCRSQSTHANMIYGILEYHENEDLKFDASKIDVLSVFDINKKTRSKTDEIVVSTDHQFHFKLLAGILLEVNANCRDVYLAITANSDGILNTILVDSSLDYNYVHAGFNSNLKSNNYCSSSSTSKSYLNWLNSIRTNLRRYKINFLIISGDIDSTLAEFCRTNSILCIKHVDLKILRKISNKFLVYLNDLTDDFVIKLKTQLYEGKYVHIKPDSADYVTVLLTGNSFYKNQMDLFKTDLKRYLKRVDNVLDSAQYSNGSGCIENYIRSFIPTIWLPDRQMGALQKNQKTEFDIAKEILTQAFDDFSSLFKVTTTDDNENCHPMIYDDLTSKMHAYRTALYIVELLVNIDAAIHD